MQPLEALSSVERKERDATSAPSASRWLHDPKAEKPVDPQLRVLVAVFGPTLGAAVHDDLVNGREWTDDNN